jgi:hypothetical protein
LVALILDEAEENSPLPRSFGPPSSGKLRGDSLAGEGELLILGIGVEHYKLGDPAATGFSGKTAAVDVMPTRVLGILKLDSDRWLKSLLSELNGVCILYGALGQFW